MRGEERERVREKTDMKREGRQKERENVQHLVSTNSGYSIKTATVAELDTLTL